MTFYNDEQYFSYPRGFESDRRYAVPQIGKTQQALDLTDEDESEEADGESAYAE